MGLMITAWNLLHKNTKVLLNDLESGFNWFYGRSAKCYWEQLN
jgi:hypothetical protein